MEGRNKVSSNQPPLVKEKSDNHSSSERVEHRLCNAPLFFSFVEAEEHWKGSPKVDSIEDGAHSVHHPLVLMRVIRNGRDGERLHERSHCGHQKHQQDGEKESYRLWRRIVQFSAPKSSQQNVCEDMIEVEVSVGHEVKEERNSVQLYHCVERVRRSQDSVKVVCPQVVSNVSENPNPNVRLEEISLKNWNVRLYFGRENEGNYEVRNCTNKSNHHQSNIGALFVIFSYHYYCKKSDPESAYEQEHHFSVSLCFVLSKPTTLMTLSLLLFDNQKKSSFQHEKRATKKVTHLPSCFPF